MRNFLLLTMGLGFSVGMFMACSSSTNSGFPMNGDDSGTPPGDDSGTDSTVSPGDTGTFGDSMNMPDIINPDAITVKTTIYANTDDTLYSMDPMTKMVTMIGPMVGTSDASGDNTVTDVAVNAAGDVYVNTENSIYKAMVPSSPGTVMLTKVAMIATMPGQKFFALAFAPKGVLGSGEALVGGDGNGELWAIDTTSGATQDLGSFGTDPMNPGYTFALSGDVVFYLDSNNMPQGLATIRSCMGTTCMRASDFLCAINMTALATAYTSHTPAASLNGGIYGAPDGGGMATGTGTGHGDLFGLGAWNSEVYAFERYTKMSSTNPGNPAQLITIDTATGLGTPVAGQTFSFMNGWSGAGVTTTVTIHVPPPPPPPM